MKKIILTILVLALAGFLGWKFFLKNIKFDLTGEAFLNWEKVEGKDVAGYKIYYGEKSRSGDCPAGGYAEKINAGNKNEFIVKGLESGKTYYFSVSAYNKSGKESCFSEEKTKKISVSFWEKVKKIITAVH